MVLSSTPEPVEDSETGAEEPAPRGRTRARRALSLALLAAGITLALFLFRAVGWPSIAANLQRIGPARMLFLLSLYAATQVAFAVGWWLLVEPSPTARDFPRLFAIYLAGDTLNYLAPGGVAGEPVKARLLGKSAGAGSALASLTIHKHADLLAQWAFVATGVAYAAARFPIPLAAKAAAVAGAAGLGGLLLVLTWAMRRGTYGPILRRLARWKPLASRLGRYHRSAEAIDSQIRDFSATHRGRYFASVFFCFLGWCGGMLETYLILRFLSTARGWGTALAVEALAIALNNMLLFVPGRVGSAEGVRAAVFVLLGMPAAAGAAYALVRRGRELAWTLPGFLVLAKEHALAIVGVRTPQPTMPENFRP